MVTLMTIGNSEGDRRCDERCYNAAHAKCSCVCGGINHGIGKASAVNNTRLWSEGLLKKTLADGVEVVPLQSTLF